MSFPSANGQVSPLTLESAWSTARNVAAQIKSNCAVQQSQITAGNVSSLGIINAAAVYATNYSQLTKSAAVPGIAAYAQAQVADPSLDVASAFGAMLTALGDVITWIRDNFPKDGSGNLLCVSIGGDGQPVWASFSTAQLSPLSVKLAALAATIN